MMIVLGLAVMLFGLLYSLWAQSYRPPGWRSWKGQPPVMVRHQCRGLIWFLIGLGIFAVGAAGS